MKTLIINILLLTVLFGHGDSHKVNKKQEIDKSLKHPHWDAPESEKNVKNPIKRDMFSTNRGAILYSKNCASCHGVNADGKSNMSKLLDPKPTNLVFMSGHHLDGDFAWKISVGKGAMPGWKDKLSQNDIWDLVNYIQSLK